LVQERGPVAENVRWSETEAAIGACAMTEVVELLCEMIRIPSVNPSGGEPQAPDQGEQRMAEFVAGYLSDRGIDCELQEWKPGRPNVIARVCGAHPGPPLVMQTHMDTVSIGGMTIDPFDPRPGEGRVWGRGSCDAKAQLAAMMTALIRVSEGAPPPQDCVLAAVADEEYGHGGVARYLEDSPEIAGAIVGEPTMLRVVVAHKGVLRPRIITRGVSAHSSDPSNGVSAIYKMAHLITALEDYANELTAREPHPLVGGPALSVGTVRGGTAVNVVPDHCEALVDRRLIPGEDLDEVWKEIRAVLDESGEADYEMQGTIRDCAVQTDVAEVVVQRARAAALAVTGDDEVAGVPYGSDASNFQDAGVPVVVCGPGDIAQAHTADEWVAIEQLEMACDLYEAFLRG